MNEVTPRNNKQTMKSTDLHNLVFESTGKFEKLGDFHKHVRKILINQSDAIFDCAQKRSNGQIELYNLDETQCNMVMASIDLNHLETISDVFVKVKNNIELVQHKTVEVSFKDQIMLPAYEAHRQYKIELAEYKREGLQIKKLKRAMKLHKKLGKQFSINEYVKTIGRELSGTELDFVSALPKSALSIVSGINKPHCTITAILKKGNMKVSPKDANIILRKAGILEKSPAGYKVSSKGEIYGFDSATSPTTTQPRWYNDKVFELLALIKNG